MTPLRVDVLAAVMGTSEARAGKFIDGLNEALKLYSINSPARLAAFLAQIGHESASLLYTTELASGAAYEGRTDLGNTEPGDGKKYRGHGLIQITGRTNHKAVRDALAHMGCPDFVEDPEAMADPRWAALSAGWYWDSRKLNALADAGNFDAITKKINGGYNGKVDRDRRWEKAKAVLAVAYDQVTPTPTPVPRVASAPAVVTSPTQEKPVLPFIAAALPAVLSAAPDLISLFKGDSKVSERNATLATAAVNIAKEALNVPNEQALMETLKTNPEAPEIVRQAVKDNWFELHEAAEKSIDMARKFNVEYAQIKDVRTVLGNLTFLELFSLVLTVGGYFFAGAALYGLNLDPQLQGAIITLMVVGGFSATYQFWLGSSAGSRTKDNAVKASAGDAAL